MSEKIDESWLFIVEWYDPLPQLKKTYLLKYYVDSHMVEMVDVRNKKLFLKKSPLTNDISSSEFFVGGKVLLYSRELDIVDYGDLKTRDKLQYQSKSISLLLTYNVYNDWGNIIHEIERNHTIVKYKSIILNNSQSSDISTQLKLNHYIQDVLVQNVSLYLSININTNANSNINDILSEYVSDIVISNNQTEYNLINELAKSSQPTALFDSSTCVIIKPHIVKSKQAGLIIDYIIKQGYEISCINSLFFDKIQSEEFLEVYKGVIPDFSDHVIQLSNGLSVALEVRAEDAVNTFRITAGPWDIGMAKELYPKSSIRGLYGIDNVKNSIHCTDLSQDAVMECQYCFSLMDT
uniref:DM10 domain-containing protein n=1 Tax=Chromulina nebulosa TaxID=96789 RepID=A0A7S0SZ01_9STRA|mmetsp:Transcript_5199/g.4687  ORF Transcript_5199/g.4687 Transcript_5199/m.4687 type:complete len:350 (+) Transcript_5199:21-1070(+)